MNTTTHKRSRIMLALALPLAVCGCSGETKVELNDVPAAVRATIEREAPGGKIMEVEKETKHGKVVYSADVTAGNDKWDITVAEDGSLVSKEKD